MTDKAAESTESAELTIITRPNCSLSFAGRLLFFCVIFFLSAVIAVGFAFAGAWLIVPFCGLEVLALGWALYYISCHVNDYECIVIKDGTVTVEIGYYREVQKIEFQRYWMQVIVLPASIQGRCRIWVKAHGQEVELGRFVDDEERLALASQLKMQTGAGYKV